MGSYLLLKVVHVLSAIVWIGGGIAFSTVTARLVRATDRATLNAMLPQVMRYMQTVAGPASGLVLLSGLGMMVVGRISFATLWIDVGLAGIALHGLFGALVMQKRMGALIQAASPAGNANDVAPAGARLRAANLTYLVIMTAVVAVMVFKPVWH